jgi:hypothetical protein
MSNHYQSTVIGGGMLQDFCSFKTAYQKELVLSQVVDPSEKHYYQHGHL